MNTYAPIKILNKIKQATAKKNAVALSIFNCVWMSEVESKYTKLKRA